MDEEQDKPEVRDTEAPGRGGEEPVEDLLARYRDARWQEIAAVLSLSLEQIVDPPMRVVPPQPPSRYSFRVVDHAAMGLHSPGKQRLFQLASQKRDADEMPDGNGWLTVPEVAGSAAGSIPDGRARPIMGRRQPEWITRPVATSLVIDATGWNGRQAAVWLTKGCIGEPPPLTVRVSPLFLAWRESLGDGEKARRRNRRAVWLNAPGNQCNWLSAALVAEDVVRSDCVRQPSAASAHLEWHRATLQAALQALPRPAPEKPTDSRIAPIDDNDADGDTGEDDKRLGRRQDWPWLEVVAEATIEYALAHGKMEDEVLYSRIQAIAGKHRTDGRMPSRTRAQTHGQIVTEAWARHARKSPDAKK